MRNPTLYRKPHNDFLEWHRAPLDIQDRPRFGGVFAFLECYSTQVSLRESASIAIELKKAAINTTTMLKSAATPKTRTANKATPAIVAFTTPVIHPYYTTSAKAGSMLFS